mgnify:CR=1 FL=1
MRHLHVFLYHLAAILYVAWVLLFGVILTAFLAGPMVLPNERLIPAGLVSLIQLPFVPYFYKKLIAWDMKYRLGVALHPSRYPDPAHPIVPTITDL